jgi:hypothetical protein
MAGYVCEECGGKPMKTHSWIVGRGASVDKETGNKIPPRVYCSTDCAVLYLMAKDRGETWR